MGYSKFIVDPSVRLAYTHRDANDVHKKEFVQGIRTTDWADVQSSAPIDWSLTPHRPYYKCARLLIIRHYHNDMICPASSSGFFASNLAR